MNPQHLSKLPFRHPELIKEVEVHGIIKEVPAGSELLHQGQAVRYIPFVLSGLVKVFTKHDEKELLLYHIAPAESCIMSLAVSLRNDPSAINAVTDEDSLILLVPVQRVLEWLKDYPELTMLFFNEFYKRYTDMVDTIRQLVFTNLESRLLEYLKETAHKHGNNQVHLRHREIAADLGTAREVISRLLKKLEKAGHISVSKEGIEVF